MADETELLWVVFLGIGVAVLGVVILLLGLLRELVKSLRDLVSGVRPRRPAYSSTPSRPPRNSSRPRRHCYPCEKRHDRCW